MEVSISLQKRVQRIVSALYWHSFKKWFILGQKKLKEYKEKNKSYLVVRKEVEPEKGTALLTYVLSPHLDDYNHDDFRSHSNRWRSREISDTLNQLGFSVDITDWRNTRAPRGDRYDIIIGLGRAFSASCTHGVNAIKIYLGTGAYVDQAIEAENARIRAFEERTSMKARRRYRTEPDYGPIVADAIFVIGSEWVMQTYRKVVSVPVLQLSNTITDGVVQNENEQKDFSRAREHFLWLASFGAIHRGLDVLLEVFRELNHLHLWICGNVKHEDDFWFAYEYELTELPNIHHIGWIDITSKTYKDIITTCAFHIYPSASDGMPGAVVNTMASGLLPIITEEAGLETNGLGERITEISIMEIEKVVLKAAQRDPDHLRKEAEAIMEYAKERYSKAGFRHALYTALVDTLTHSDI